MSIAQVRVWRNDLALFDRMVETTRGSAYADIASYKLAIAQMDRGHDADALRNFLRIVKKYPYNAEMLYNTASALFHLNRLDEAKTCYIESVRLEPFDAQAHNGLGIALGASGDLDGAMREFKEALRINPSLIDAYRNMGTVLTKQGKPNEAKTYFEKARELKSSSRP